ncbi:MAG: DUF1343 domain-containing protein [Prevotellaceae bacterium]|nr:DUF1343 domain-containing protein [Prevotellaceae bacterium]
MKFPFGSALLPCLLLACVPVLCRAQTHGVVCGDARPSVYLPLLQGKRIALFSNHTGMVGQRHILDVLLEQGVGVTTLFSPEHGFRGDADAGEQVSNAVDTKTGIPILSLYGGAEKLLNESLMHSFDLVVVDIQDVGLRYYTYYITMCRLMDACARYGTPMVILDRPNPNGFYVDGPLLDMKYKSGVGWLPIPVVHGMTLGELARMVNGEGWLPGGRTCDLTVVPCLNYTHQTRYRLAVAPSPNLPDMKSVYLYASLCFFDATPVSLGRGTPLPFQVYGHPDMKGYMYSFTPQSRPGAKHPPQQGKLCHGVNLSGLSDEAIWERGVDLSYLIDAYRSLHLGDRFFSSFFERLIGVDYVRGMIEAGSDADEIKARWQGDVARFKERRKPYLLYEE